MCKTPLNTNVHSSADNKNLSYIMQENVIDLHRPKQKWKFSRLFLPYYSDMHCHGQWYLLFISKYFNIAIYYTQTTQLYN